MKNLDFKYRRSYRIPYRGCSFDSLLEVKFAMSVEKDFCFLLEPVKIGYNPDSQSTTDYFCEGTRIYTPDFLIQHKNSNRAFLVEI